MPEWLLGGLLGIVASLVAVWAQAWYSARDRLKSELLGLNAYFKSLLSAIWQNETLLENERFHLANGGNPGLLPLIPIPLGGVERFLALQPDGVFSTQEAEKVVMLRSRLAHVARQVEVHQIFVMQPRHDNFVRDVSLLNKAIYENSQRLAEKVMELHKDIAKRYGRTFKEIAKDIELTYRLAGTDPTAATNKADATSVPMAEKQV